MKLLTITVILTSVMCKSAHAQSHERAVIPREAFESNREDFAPALNSHLSQVMNRHFVTTGPLMWFEFIVGEVQYFRRADLNHENQKFTWTEAYQHCKKNGLRLPTWQEVHENNDKVNRRSLLGQRFWVDAKDSVEVHKKSQIYPLVSLFHPSLPNFGFTEFSPLLSSVNREANIVLCVLDVSMRDAPNDANQLAVDADVPLK